VGQTIEIFFIQLPAPPTAQKALSLQPRYFGAVAGGGEPLPCTRQKAHGLSHAYFGDFFLVGLFFVLK